MRLVANRKALKRTLRWIQGVLLVSAVVLLSYCAFVLLDSWIFQEQQARDLDRLLDDQRTSAVTPRSELPTAPIDPQPPLPAVRSSSLTTREARSL